MSALTKAIDRLARNPSRPALRPRPGAAWMTVGTLLRRARKLAAALADAGVRRGDVVMSVIGSRPAFFVATFAVWEREAVLLPVDAASPAAEIDALRRAFRPAAIVTERAGRLRIDRGSTKPRRYPGAAMIRLTSGTTGAPRGALITPAQAIADGRAILGATGLLPSDASVAVVPLGHTYGFDNVVMPLLLQGTPAVLLERPLPSLVLRALRSRRPVLLSAVPYLIDLLARHPGAGRIAPLRACLSAGPPSRRGARRPSASASACRSGSSTARRRQAR